MQVELAPVYLGCELVSWLWLKHGSFLPAGKVLPRGDQAFFIRFHLSYASDTLMQSRI